MYCETMLIPFDMVLDTDFSIVRILQTMYYSNLSNEIPKHIFYDGIMSLINPDDSIYLEELLINRLYENPLSTIIKPDYLPTDAEPLLSQIIDKHYDEIVKIGRKTAIFEMIRHGYNMKDSGFSPTILYELDCQMITLKKYFSDENISYPFVSLEDLTNLDQYGSIYCKSETILQKIIDKGISIEGRNIMVTDHRYNFNDNESRSKGVLNPEIYKKYELMQNKLFILNMYNLDNKTVG